MRNFLQPQQVIAKKTCYCSTEDFSVRLLQANRILPLFIEVARGTSSIIENRGTMLLCSSFAYCRRCRRPSVVVRWSKEIRNSSLVVCLYILSLSELQQNEKKRERSGLMSLEMLPTITRRLPSSAFRIP